jgi:hypothetical protein
MPSDGDHRSDAELLAGDGEAFGEQQTYVAVTLWLVRFPWFEGALLEWISGWLRDRSRGGRSAVAVRS